MIGVYDKSWVNENVEWVDLTPELAAKWLETNSNWRTARTEQVSFLSREMSAGRWQQNGEAIKFDVDGKMVDGQHRCLAVINSGVTIKTMVIRGVKATEFDRGFGRKHNQHLDALGVENPKVVSAIVFSLWKQENGFNFYWHGGKNPTNDEMDAVMRRHSALVDKWSRLSRIDGIANGAWLPIIMVQFALIDQAKAEEFHSLLSTGAGLDVDHPILSLRNKLLKEFTRKSLRLSVIDRISMVIIAWNAWLKGEKLKMNQLRISVDFPEIGRPGDATKVA